ncbi:MAG: hypothetical protein ACRENL_04485 [Candidatus Dormibacteria bacterium]
MNDQSLEQRWEEIKDRPILVGSHSPDGEMCVMEMVAYVAGEEWTDRPRCASPVISDFLRVWNDAMNDEDRQMLKPLIPRLVGSNASKAMELRRSHMALDWYIRVSASAWLRLALLDAEADALGALGEVTDATSAWAAQTALGRAQKSAQAAGSAAWSAAGSALRPTVEHLQREALVLVERMLAVTDEVLAA